MPISIIAILLLSSCIHATWNFLSKTIPSGAVFVWLVAVVTASLYLPLVIYWLCMFGFETSSSNLLSLLLTGTLHMVYYLVLQRGYQVGDLSVVYPVARGAGPLFATIGAYIIFGERGTWWSVAGLLLVVLGVLLITGLRNPLRAEPRTQVALVYGLLTGFLIATYTLWDTYVVRTLLIAPLLVDYVSHPMRVVLLAPMVWRKQGEALHIWQTYRTKILIIGLLNPISFILVLYALRHAPIHYVAPVRELSIVLGVFFGGKFLLEKDFKNRLLGAFIIVLGIVLLSLGV